MHWNLRGVFWLCGLAILTLTAALLGADVQAHGSDEQEQDTVSDVENSAVARVSGLTDYVDSAVTMDADMAPPFIGGITPIADLVGLGDTQTLYDVFLQPGHYGRTSGSTGGGGARISEQKFAAGIVERLASRVQELGHSVAVIPADGFARLLKAYVFLSIHADGSSSPCASAPSLAMMTAAICWECTWWHTVWVRRLDTLTRNS